MESVALVGRLLLSLAVVLALMWVIARRMKRGTRGKNGKLIELLSRQQLSRSASVAVVRVLDQALIVGITDGQVTVLGEAEMDDVQAALTLNDAPPRPPRPARARPQRPERPVANGPQAAIDRGALTGSALSLNTWRQTLDSLRDLTARRT